MTTYYNIHELTDFLVSIGGDDEHSMANIVLTECTDGIITKGRTEYISHTSLAKVLPRTNLNEVASAGLTTIEA